MKSPLDCLQSLRVFLAEFSRAVGLRWGDAGAEGLRAVLPAVDLLDGPDKDPFSSIFMASRHPGCRS